MKKYKLVVVGGTFDHFHRGHEALLRKAFEVGEHVMIGITSDEFARKTKSHPVEPYDRRKMQVESFLKSLGVTSFEIAKIEDAYGITLTHPSIDAIVVSDGTMPRAIEINELRKRRGLKPLEIVSIARVVAEDGLPISSTRIIKGEIDREGNVVKP